MRASLSCLFRAGLLVACGDDSTRPGGSAPLGGSGGDGAGAGGNAGGAGGVGGTGGEGNHYIATEPGPIALEVIARDLEQPIFVAAHAGD